MAAARNHGIHAGQPIRIALIGVGKIARDQHAPALRKDERFQIAATVSHEGSLPGIPGFKDLDSLLRASIEVDAVSICTPPLHRCSIAADALRSGLHVMLEKPPGIVPGDVEKLARAAYVARRTLFASWHSREAACVAVAREWLGTRQIRSVRTTWKEDIRVWHPGQHWILESEGFGVFDPGINALSILTHILPQPFTMRDATLSFPSNRGAPIAAELDLVYADTVPAPATFDFLYAGEPQWDIEVATDAGTLTLREGGRSLEIDGAPQQVGDNQEYPRLYSRFAGLIAANECEVDLAPLHIVFEALALGRRIDTAAFEF
jgi:predicted dehydrogenase